MSGNPFVFCFCGKDITLVQQYFNHIYTPVYDFTTARLAVYDTLHGMCIDSLEFHESDRVLCVGVGTGNELLRILQKNPGASLTGIDFSPRALKKARKKTNDICFSVMNAEKLGFRDESFDVVLCIHVTDFVNDVPALTSEILRVLKKGGRFVITWPSDGQSASFGLSLLKPGFSHGSLSGKNSFVLFFGSLTRVFASVVYLPLMLRFFRKAFSEKEIRELLGKMGNTTLNISVFDTYHDYIVSGRKS